MKKIIVLLMTVTFIIACLLQPAFAVDSASSQSPGMSNFIKIQTYNEDIFDDILIDKWYYSEVVNANSYGIMKGVGNNKFNPDGTMTIAEAITIASRINSIYNGGTGDIPPIDPTIWYSGNIFYAENNGIMDQNEYKGQYNEPVTRAQLAHLYYKTIPSIEFSAINDLISIPDLSEDDIYYNDILSLYKAGVIMGTDSKGSFKPDADITRAEAAAILNRIIDPDKRKTISGESLEQKNAFDQLKETGQYVIGSGEIYGQGDCLFYTDVYPDLSDNGIQKNLKWYIFIDPAGGPNFDTVNYECEIIMTKWNFDLESRHEVREALKILYPTGFDQVYECIMKSLNFDLWEAGEINTLNSTSGTMWTQYSDGRAINVQFQSDNGSLRIYLYKTGYIQTPPEQADPIVIKAITETSKNFAGWLNVYDSCQLGTY